MKKKNGIFRRLWGHRAGRVVCLVLFAVALFVSFRGAILIAKIHRWNTMGWAPQYLLNGPSRETVPDNEKHLIFVITDHYEPGVKPQSPEWNRQWCEKFRVLSDKYRDDYGNRFRYTWFYPYDHHVDEVMYDLSRMVFDGYGEIEFHWHIGTKSEHDMTRENFSEKTAEAVKWFQQFGAMITEEEQPRSAFAYIAGVWDLDASRTPESHGLTNQLEVLHQNGCYADFSFATIGSSAQPRKINAIYYVEDDPDEPKSYDDGVDAEVGKSVDDKLMIFEGPLAINWMGRLEYGAIESDPRFHPDRIPVWLETNIHVKGRPEWVFVKLHTHGAQASKVVLDHDMEWMLKELKSYTTARGIKLHFMSAREAYNVVKAAEAGKTGNPEDYRDFYIPKYQNMVREFPPAEPSAETGAMVE